MFGTEACLNTAATPACIVTTTTTVGSLLLRTAETLKAVVEALNKNPTIMANGGGGSGATTTKHVYSLQRM
jgi:Flp pilus assembly CpaF family ATPase